VDGRDKPGHDGHMNIRDIRADHLAGGAFIALGILVLIIGFDLPFGRISAPGAGMLPKLMAALMIAFGAIIAVASTNRETLSDIPWGDFGHAALVIVIGAIATFLYSRLGFLATMPLLIFALLVVVERRNLVVAAAFAICLTLFAYWLFAILLKAPLERGTIWS
jgi:putative tricarboxylic transport membrane protein